MVAKKEKLYTPGPTTVPPEVLQASAQPILYHRSNEFREMFRALSANAENIFRTKNPVLTLTCSATGAAEAAIQNIGAAGEKAACIMNGRFGERWFELMTLYGIKTEVQNYEWGKAVEPEHIRTLLRDNPDISMIWMVHCETSTGTWNDIQKVAEIIKKESNALLCVDAVTSMGVHECLMDEWGIDVLITGSQKGFMSPPGISFIALSERAWQKVFAQNRRGMYFDLVRALKNYEKGLTPWTPAITLMAAARLATEMILQEGLENVWSRHQRLADMFRNKMDTIGLQNFSETPCNALSALYIPPNVPDITERLLGKYGIRVSKGQEKAEGIIFRVAHMGYCNEQDIEEIADAIEEILRQ